MSLKEELCRSAYKAGGSFKTRDARVQHVERFAVWLKGANIQIKSIEHIKAKHLRDFSRARLDEGIKPRTIANEMASLRGVLRHEGRHQLVALPELSNKSLGLGGQSRVGSKTALTPERVDELVAFIIDEGIRAIIFLEQALGLRGEEAVKSGKSLKTWAKDLKMGRPVRVIYGTKGGRPRTVFVFDRERAVEAVEVALKIAATRGGKLIDKPNEKTAMGRYSRQMHAAGFRGKESGHALRYQFAHDQFHGYLEQGLSRGEALSAVAMDLGHGDGRGRWVSNTYLL